MIETLKTKGNSPFVELAKFTFLNKNGMKCLISKIRINWIRNKILKKLEHD